MTDRLPGTKFVLFSLVCLAAAFWVASVSGNFSRLPFIDRVGTFEAVIAEASGLAVGDDVRIAGVDVGRVNAITLEQGNAVVRFEVDEDVRPTTTWQAGARWRNVTGQRFLYLYPQPGGTELVSGALGRDARGRIPVEQSVAVADLAAFVQNLTPLLEALDPANQNKVIAALNETLAGRDQTIQSLVTNISELAGTVTASEPEIRSVITNANLLLTEFNAREDQLTGLIDQLSSVSDTLARRNGEVLDAAVDLAEVQRQLGAMIEANDAGLLTTADHVRRITDSIAGQRTQFEESLASLADGLGTYMLISRRGEWFNVRAVAVQVQQGGIIVSCSTETGTTCAFPSSSQGAGAPGGGDGQPPQPPQPTPPQPQPPPPAQPTDQPTTRPTGPPSATPPVPPVLTGVDPAAIPAGDGVLALQPQRLPALDVVTGVPLLATTPASPGGGG